MPDQPVPTAAAFAAALDARRSETELAKIQRYFKTGKGEYAEGDVFIGVRMGEIFAMAKQHVDMPLAEIEKLLDDPIHERRVGALSIMAKQAARKKTPEARRKELYELYLRRHDRVNNWDLVDLAVWDVVGGWLVDKPRDVLYDLARSKVQWERRTAILATMSFMPHGQHDDAYRIAELLLDDPEELVQKAIGGTLRNAGRRDRPGLEAFLKQHAGEMARVALRTALEHFEPTERATFMAKK